MSMLIPEIKSDPVRQRVRLISGCLLLSALVSGCSTVRFNERETLARPDMQFDATPLQAELESHIYSSREGASGGFSTSGGGGCGCF